MNKPHKHSELIKAWADGAQIQVKYLGWADVDEPNWGVNKEYRIKPKQTEYYKFGDRFMLRGDEYIFCLTDISYEKEYLCNLINLRNGNRYANSKQLIPDNKSINELFFTLATIKKIGSYNTTLKPLSEPTLLDE